MTNLQIGQLATKQQRFCPYAAVTKWPYKHLHGEVRRVVSDNYFAFGIFKTHGWHIYYIRTLLDTTDKPLLLVTEEEVQKLFDKVNIELGIHVAFPGVTEEPGFQLDFLEDGSPRPRYLGRLTEDCDVATLEDMIPTQGSAAEESEQLDERSFPMFRRHMQLALEAGKQKSKAARDRRKMDRVDAKKKRCAELKRTQCYLGLRKRGHAATQENFITGPNMSWEEEQKAQSAYETAAGIKLPPLNTSLPAPCSPYRAPVFICVDIEVWERDHRKLTEIGVCTLDTQDLVDVAPGEKAQEWIKKLRCRHFRILEHAHMNNSEFVTGCADRFEFGQSEWISVKDAPYVLANCFKAPFSEPGKYTPYSTEPKQGARHISKPQEAVREPNQEKRNIILVGHEIGSDIGYMRNAGYDVGNLPNLIEAVDTTVLFRAYKHEQNPRSLGAVLLELGLTGWNLHNAGNDATYTMHSLLVISVASLLPRNTYSEEPPTEELQEAEVIARERIRGDYHEWSLAEAEGGDGGDPVALLPWTQAQEKASFDKGMKTANKIERKKEDRDAARGSGFGRSRRGGGGSRGGRGNAGARGGAATTRKHEPEVRTLDMDAMDEAMMGVAGAGAGSGDIEAASQTWTAEPVWQESPSWDGTNDVPQTVASNAEASTGRDGKHSGYLPPHLRRPQPGPPAKENSNPLSDRMTARLKMLDMDG